VTAQKQGSIESRQQLGEMVEAKMSHTEILQTDSTDTIHGHALPSANGTVTNPCHPPFHLLTLTFPSPIVKNRNREAV